MKLGLYIKSRFECYVLEGLALIMALIVLMAFEVSVYAIILVGALIIIGFTITEIMDYFRRKKFFDRLLEQLSFLDQKYLLVEMVEKPDFYEGEIIYDVLRETGKSMSEYIGAQRRENIDFREYIELWVHEIKLPIASLQLMCHNDGNKKYSRQLSRIDNYIENVLYYTRSDSAEKDYMIRDVSLKKLVTEVAVRYREELQMKNINLNIGNLDVLVLTDSKWLMYMIGQLMTNSIKFTDVNREAEILIDSKETEEFTILIFRDNGIGISEADLPYVFEKSFTGVNGRKQSKSTGIGLYLVKKLCDKLGHRIEVKSNLGEYTEFRIYFAKNMWFLEDD